MRIVALCLEAIDKKPREFMPSSGAVWDVIHDNSAGRTRLGYSSKRLPGIYTIMALPRERPRNNRMRVSVNQYYNRSYLHNLPLAAAR